MVELLSSLIVDDDSVTGIAGGELYADVGVVRNWCVNNDSV